MNKTTQPAQRKWKHNASKLSKSTKKETAQISIIVINVGVNIEHTITTVKSLNTYDIKHWGLR